MTVRGRLCNGTEIKMRTQEQTGVESEEGSSRKKTIEEKVRGKSLVCTLGWSL